MAEEGPGTGDLFAGPWIDALLGGTLHPGGEAATLVLAEAAGLPSGSRVLDAASGRGTSMELLASRYGWDMVGVDASTAQLRSQEDLGRRVCGLAGDDLPFRDGAFDGVLSECSLCLVGGDAALAEYARVLRPGGVLMLSDVTLERPLAEPPEWAATLGCIRGARPRGALRAGLEDSGFEVVEWTDRRAWMADLRARIHDRVEVDEACGFLEATPAGRPLARFIVDVEAAFAAGELGYVSCVARRQE